MIIADPLIADETELAVEDLASARYALKIANDNYFAVFHMRELADRAIARSAAENKAQAIALVEPYVERRIDPITLQPLPLRELPEPLPASVPAAVRAALEWFEAQLELERQRAYAEVEAEAAVLEDMVEAMKLKVAAWYRGEVGKSWLGGRNSVTIGGCTLTYDGEVSFEFHEMDYE